MLSTTGDRGFESISLQRGVYSEPDFRGRDVARPAHRGGQLDRHHPAPRVLFTSHPVTGRRLEPIEEVVVDVDEEFAGIIVDNLAHRKAAILDITEAPEAVDIVLINRPELPPAGAGESSIRPVAAALANAVFDATGVRLRRAPLTPERLKPALA